jgi:hypothetical protein
VHPVLFLVTPNPGETLNVVSLARVQVNGGIQSRNVRGHHEPAKLGEVPISGFGPHGATLTMNDFPIPVCITAIAINGPRCISSATPGRMRDPPGRPPVDAAIASACAPICLDHWKMPERYQLWISQAFPALLRSAEGSHAEDSDRRGMEKAMWAVDADARQPIRDDAALPLHRSRIIRGTHHETINATRSIK